MYDSMKQVIVALFLFLGFFLPLKGDGGSWVAIDGLGRSLPTAEECPLKTDGKPRTVGIFYITWHTQGLHNGQPYTYDAGERQS